MMVEIYVIIRLIQIYFIFMFCSISLLIKFSNVGTPLYYVYPKSEYFYMGGRTFWARWDWSFISTEIQEQINIRIWEQSFYFNENSGLLNYFVAANWNQSFFLGIEDLTPSYPSTFMFPCFILFSSFIMLESSLCMLIEFLFHFGPFRTRHKMFSSC